MGMPKPDPWKAVDLDTLLTDVVEAVESGEIDSAFDQVNLTSGKFSRTKTTRNYAKNYLLACLKAGVEGITEANPDTALGLVNAFRNMNSEPLLNKLPAGYKVFAIKLPHGHGNPDIEIYIKDGNRVLYGEKIFPRGILTENFLLVAESKLLSL